MKTMLNTWTWRYLEKLFPLWKFLKKYDGNTAVCDVVAGITVGLTLIPQCIAYASLAGLDPQYGLYSSLCGGIIYAVFGTIPELNIAPTALLSLLTYQYTHNVTFGNVKAAVMLTFFAGIFELFSGILHLGFLVDFVSLPVVSAFTSAGAITIATSQVKNLFGLKFTAESFVDVWKQFFIHIGEVKLWDTLLGFVCITILLLMRKLKDYGVPPIKTTSPEKQAATYKKCIWFVSVGRNAMVVISCAVLAFIFKYHDHKPFALTSKVPSGFPNISIPLKPVETINGTNGTSIPQMISELGYGLVVIPFVAILANVGIAKAFARGNVVDASQEMIAVGLCNIFGSFFGSYPVNASFSRAAVSSASGVRTPVSGIYTGIMVIMAFTFLTPYFSYIPKATLAAVIICAVVFMVEITIAKSIWYINKLDLIPFIITFVSCLLIGIELGILIGILVEICKLMYFTARPKILTSKKITGNKTYLKMVLTSSVFFSSAEHIREKIVQYATSTKSNVSIVLVDCTNVISLDYTAGKCFSLIADDLQKKGTSVAFLVSRDRIIKTLENCGNKNFTIFQTEYDFEQNLNGKNEGLHNDIESVTTQM
ncbi:sodium-independent sulfate anion transporter-like [Sitophilus oryzae]|uniref:Sodium-independent sulfate anion transporter-like n=1 Tax=Sitophilus oryzae TaxID=7048 RepID=A0A6J2YM59_SITOR|nr:sodium-independent sulfate anion transporter-like [Sitophilus oryzae]